MAGKCITGKKEGLSFKICRGKDGQFKAKSGGRKRKARRKTSSKLACKAGTLGKYGKACGCYTKGGGFTFKPKSKCKGKGRKKARR